MKKITFILNLLLVLVSLSHAREWNNKEGKKIYATMQSVEGDKVLLKMNRGDKVYKVAIDSLSQADQEYIKQRSAELEEEKKAEEAKHEERLKQATIIHGVQLKSGIVTQINGIPIPEEYHKENGKKDYDAAFILPANFDPRKKYTIAQVYIAGSNNAIKLIRPLKSTATKANCVVIAVNLQGSKTVIAEFELYDLLEEKWKVKSNRWPMIHVGCSGGAKKSALFSAHKIEMGLNVVGCFMSGVNEDRFKMGLEVRAKKKSVVKKQYRKMAVFLCSGTSDKVATPADHVKVKSLIDKQGIKASKIHTFTGGHVAKFDLVPEAITWILANSDHE